MQMEPAIAPPPAFRNWARISRFRHNRPRSFWFIKTSKSGKTSRIDVWQSKKRAAREIITSRTRERFCVRRRFFAG
jgi:hypothetical protein